MSKKPVAKSPSHAKHPKAQKLTLGSLEKQITTLEGEVSSLKHAGTSKHKAGGKAKGKAAGKTSKHAVVKSKARGLGLGEGVACCAAEAVAASARLAGLRVADDDVLELHWLAGGTADEGVSIAAALETAVRFGLAGHRPLGFGEVMPSAACELRHRSVAGLRVNAAGLIVGLDLPGGPHTICIDREPGICWSWGEPHSLARLALGPADEAWAVAW